MVLVYFSLRPSSLAKQFSSDFSCTREESNYLGAGCCLLPTAFRHRVSGHCVWWYSQEFRETLRLLQILSLPACLLRMIQCRTTFLLANLLSCSIFTLKHVEVKHVLDCNGTLKTQPMGKRTATGERFSSAEKYSNGRMA